jgi:hypothetical protein
VGEWESRRVGEWESGRVGESESGRVGECWLRRWKCSLGNADCGLPIADCGSQSGERMDWESSCLTLRAQGAGEEASRRFEWRTDDEFSFSYSAIALSTFPQTSTRNSRKQLLLASHLDKKCQQLSFGNGDSPA